MVKESKPAANPQLDETRIQLLVLLRGGEAHAGFETAITDFPADLRGKVPDGLPYSAWQLLEHMRITQRDILNFSAPPTGGFQAILWAEDDLATPGPPA